MGLHGVVTCTEDFSRVQFHNRPPFTFIGEFMGLFYNTMIREIKEDFVKSKFDNLEEFLKQKEYEYKEKYNLSDLLFYLNICELLNRETIKSEYFTQKFYEQEN